MNISEAARRLGVSEKTIRRRILHKTLPAQLVGTPGRYEIDESDLEQASLQPSTEDRIAALEARVLALERQAEEREQPTYKQLPKRIAPQSASSIGVSSLPSGYVGISDFYHGVPETTANRLIMSLAIRGNWIAEGHAVRRALDREAQAKAYEALRSHPAFIMCEECPHAM